MVFDALQVKALEGFNKFYKYDRPSINWPSSSESIFSKLIDNILYVCFRPNVEELKNHLKDLGANFVVTEEDLKSSEMKATMKVSLHCTSYNLN